MRLFLMRYGNRVRAVQFPHGLAHGLEQVAAIDAVNQVGDDFGIGRRDKLVALSTQHGTQCLVVVSNVETGQSVGLEKLFKVLDGLGLKMLLLTPSDAEDAARALRPSADESV